MANPILSKPDAFTRSSEYRGYTGYQQGPYGPAHGQAMPGYGQGMPGYAPGMPGYAPQPAAQRGVMTLDDVIAKTAITLLVVALTAAVTWFFLPEALEIPALFGSSVLGFVTVMFVASRREIPVGGVMVYAVIQGIFIGVFSKWFEGLYPGIVGQAVLATFITAGAVLFAYRFFNIRVTPKFQKGVLIATMALAGVLLVNFALAMFNVNTGLREIGSGAGWLSIGVSVLAVVLAVLNLIVDFDQVERGIAQQAPAKESWRAAFGITITMVWLYVELLRILSYFRE